MQSIIKPLRIYTYSTPTVLVFHYLHREGLPGISYTRKINPSDRRLEKTGQVHQKAFTVSLLPLIPQCSSSVPPQGKAPGFRPHTICAAAPVLASPRHPKAHTPQPGAGQPPTPTPRPLAGQDAAAHLPGSLLNMAAADGGGGEAADTGGQHDRDRRQRPLVRPARPSSGWRG